MKKYCILAILCYFSYLAAAQTPVEKGLESINRASAEAYIGFLAHDELQGRGAIYCFIASGNGSTAIRRQLFSTF